MPGRSSSHRCHLQSWRQRPSLGRYHRRLLPRRRGAALVEFAITCPLLILFALATADFGRIVAAYQTVANAARLSSEYGSTHGHSAYTQAAWLAEVRQTVTDELQNQSGFNAANLTVNIATTPDADGLDQVSVDVLYPFQTVVAWPGLPSTVNVRHAVIMREIR